MDIARYILTGLIMLVSFWFCYWSIKVNEDYKPHRRRRLKRKNKSDHPEYFTPSHKH